jgi:sugar/nucleoside kinase (ribokinase family)
MEKIIGIGNALVDAMIKLPLDSLLQELQIPKGSMQLVDKATSSAILQKTEGFTSQHTSGGSAANTIHGLASLGIETAFVGTIGKDKMGQVFKNDLILNHIKPILVESSEDTGIALALVSPDSERTFATCLGAAVQINADDITSDLLKGYNYLHLEGYLVQNQALIEKAASIGKQNNMIVSLDLASYNVVDSNRDFLIRLIKDKVDIVFANEEESKSLTGKDPENALEEISEMCSIAVVKIGKEGSWIKKGKEKVRIKAIPSSCIDTTGAGDLFAAGFLFGLIHHYSLENCGNTGALLAGKVIENLGAKIPASTWTIIKDEIVSFAEK